jgi:H+/Cl- antiporter ClcA
MYDHYLPIVIAALTILLLGCLNPRVFQSTRDGVPTGHPSYMWLALMALLAGLLSCYLMHPGKYSSRSMRL